MSGKIQITVEKKNYNLKFTIENTFENLYHILSGGREGGCDWEQKKREKRKVSGLAPFTMHFMHCKSHYREQF
jgi:hypothetical protein